MIFWPCDKLQEMCWKLCSRFFDLDLANGLLEQSYAAQHWNLLGFDPWPDADHR